MTKPNNPNENIFYTYVYLDPRKPGNYSYCNGNINFDYEPFYVGEGYGRRYENHIKEAKKKQNKKGNQHKLNIIRQIWKKLDQDPIIIFYERGVNKLISQHLECLLIAKIGRQDLDKGPLTNLTDGGDGNIGSIKTDKWKKTHSSIMLSLWADPIYKKQQNRKGNNKGRKATKIQIDRMSSKKKLYWQKLKQIGGQQQNNPENIVLRLLNPIIEIEQVYIRVINSKTWLVYKFIDCDAIYVKKTKNVLGAIRWYTFYINKPFFGMKPIWIDEYGNKFNVYKYSDKLTDEQIKELRNI